MPVVIRVPDHEESIVDVDQIEVEIDAGGNEVVTMTHVVRNLVR